MALGVGMCGGACSGGGRGKDGYDRHGVGFWEAEG